MPFRKIIFWLHLASGLIAGAIIAIMSVTGIAIAFEEEILAWIDRKPAHIAAPAANARPKTIAELTALLRQTYPDLNVTTVVVPRDPQRAYEFYAGRDGPLYVDPHTGLARESRAHAAHDFIHTLEEWHRWLGRPNGLTSTGRLVTGISNFAFLILCLTGLWLWFPKLWNARALRPRLAFIKKFRGKARDFNWHHVFGFWSMPVLTLLAATGVVISFDWAHRLVFTLAGEEAPKARNYGMMAVPLAVVPTPSPGTKPVSAEALLASVGVEFPDWQSLHLTLASPSTNSAPLKPVSLGVTLPDAMPSRAYVPVELDPFTGEILQATRFQNRSAGLQARV
ncbi:MAG TPA: PepSY-associated TM helix domain-containing protein, partial [Opitutus sp.]|nr:PepSY-associated TM helix domain-containing protein [Opitutus sp.]